MNSSAERLRQEEVFWFFGLSGAGKTTIARAVADSLMKVQRRIVILDGDDLRTGLCKDLGFSFEDRKENIRRAAELAKIMSNQGFLVLAAFMSPQESMRQLARSIIGESFRQIYIKCDLSICINRDTKSLYDGADTGRIKYLPGKDLVFEEPLEVDLILETDAKSLDECVEMFLQLLERRGDQ